MGTPQLPHDQPSIQEGHPMQLDKITTGARELAQTYRITKGDTFRWMYNVWR